MAAAAASLLLPLLSLFHPNLNHYLLPGDVLRSGEKMSYKKSTMTMQQDCDLVIRSPNGRFHSGTAGLGERCHLTLVADGRLVIRNSHATEVWSTPKSPVGRTGYIAVLLPNGQLSVYGPNVWSTPAPNLRFPERTLPPIKENILVEPDDIFAFHNITNGGFTLAMKPDCNLVVEKAGAVVWQSGTSGRGVGCLARLTNHGTLFILNDQFNTVWSSGPPEQLTGQSVLVLHDDGHVGIYARAVWVTPRSSQ